MVDVFQLSYYLYKGKGKGKEKKKEKRKGMMMFFNYHTIYNRKRNDDRYCLDDCYCFNQK